MNLSSILVYSSPGRFDEVHAALEKLPGVEVHHQCRDTGRTVAILEVAEETDEQEGLRTIKSLPQVMAAVLVYHYQEQEQRNESAAYDAKEALS